MSVFPMDKDKFAFYLLGGLLGLCAVAVITIVSIGFLFWK